MATARIEAGFVAEAALSKATEIESVCAAWRAEQIAKVQRHPKIAGPFWRRTITVLSAEEAKAEYERLCGIHGTKQWWDEMDEPSHGLRTSRRIHRLALTAVTDGDGYVTLDADEVRLLGLSAKAAA